MRETQRPAQSQYYIELFLHMFGSIADQTARKQQLRKVIFSLVEGVPVFRLRVYIYKVDCGKVLQIILLETLHKGAEKGERDEEMYYDNRLAGDRRCRFGGARHGWRV